jgi:hypothetical protein
MTSTGNIDSTFRELNLLRISFKIHFKGCILKFLDIAFAFKVILYVYQKLIPTYENCIYCSSWQSHSGKC